jgi:hypothetical protein
MSVSSVSSTPPPAVTQEPVRSAPAQRPPESRPAEKTPEARRPDNQQSAQAAASAEKPRPVVNTEGQTTGQVVNVTA